MIRLSGRDRAKAWFCLAATCPCKAESRFVSHAIIVVNILLQSIAVLTNWKIITTLFTWLDDHQKNQNRA